MSLPRLRLLRAPLSRRPDFDLQRVCVAREYRPPYPHTIILLYHNTLHRLRCARGSPVALRSCANRIYSAASTLVVSLMYNLFISPINGLTNALVHVLTDSLTCKLTCKLTNSTTSSLTNGLTIRHYLCVIQTSVCLASYSFARRHNEFPRFSYPCRWPARKRHTAGDAWASICPESCLRCYFWSGVCTTYRSLPSRAQGHSSEFGQLSRTPSG